MGGRTDCDATERIVIYMVVEQFKNGPGPVYARFRERGRMAPAGLDYINSWITVDGSQCYQVMECADRELLDTWLAAWSDIVEFTVIPVITSAEAASKY